MAKSAAFSDFDISIHAPLTGCDGQEDAIAILQTISIHAPLTGCDEYNIL